MPDKTITGPENTEVNINIDKNEEKSIAQTESEFMEETVKGIKETQKAILNQDETKPIEGTPSSLDKTETPEGQQVHPDLAGTEIPEVFSSLAEEMGMTPTEIIAIADSHTDEQLLEMAALLKESMDVDVDDVDDNEYEDEPPAEKDEKAEDATQKLIDQVTAKVKAELGVGLSEINEFKEQQAAQQDKQTLETANRKFDEAAKEFPIFGETEKLPRFTTGKLKGRFIPTSPAYKARMEVVKYADAFMGMGNSVEEAMDLALATYKGKNLRTEVERNLIKDLKQHEKNLSGVRTGKETKTKHASSREDIIDDIRALQRKAGVEV